MVDVLLSRGNDIALGFRKEAEQARDEAYFHLKQVAPPCQGPILSRQTYPGRLCFAWILGRNLEYALGRCATKQK